MLKNVVLPAPLGPMIETIDFSGISIETSLTATQAAEVLGHVFGARGSPARWRRPSAAGGA